MKKRVPLKEKFRDSLVSALEVPGDLAWRDTLVTLTGSHQSVIENFRKLIKCSDREMIVRCQAGCLIIQGRNLKISRFQMEEMEVSGQISGIRMEGR